MITEPKNVMLIVIYFLYLCFKDTIRLIYLIIMIMTRTFWIFIYWGNS